MLDFLQNNLTLILTIIAELVVGITTTIVLIKKNKDVKVNSSNFSSLIADLPTLIDMAEKITGLDGTSKKTYVMQQISLRLASMGISANTEELKNLSDMVDSLVALSKSINTHKKTTTAETSNMIVTEEHTPNE